MCQAKSNHYRIYYPLEVRRVLGVGSVPVAKLVPLSGTFELQLHKPQRQFSGHNAPLGQLTAIQCVLVSIVAMWSIEALILPPLCFPRVLHSDSSRRGRCSFQMGSLWFMIHTIMRWMRISTEGGLHCINKCLLKNGSDMAQFSLQLYPLHTRKIMRIL